MSSESVTGWQPVNTLLRGEVTDYDVALDRFTDLVKGRRILSEEFKNTIVNSVTTATTAYIPEFVDHRLVVELVRLWKKLTDERDIYVREFQFRDWRQTVLSDLEQFKVLIYVLRSPDNSRTLAETINGEHPDLEFGLEYDHDYEARADVQELEEYRENDEKREKLLGDAQRELADKETHHQEHPGTDHPLAVHPSFLEASATEDEDQSMSREGTP